MENVKIVGVLCLLVTMVAAINCTAAYYDDFSTDTSGNYVLGECFDWTATEPIGSMSFGPSELTVTGSGGNPYLKNTTAIWYLNQSVVAESLDAGEYAEVTITMDSIGGEHWRCGGIFVSDVAGQPADAYGPKVYGASSSHPSAYGRGFTLLYDPALPGGDGHADELVHVESFGGADPSADDICGMGPGDLPVTTVTGNTHVLRIEKGLGSMDFYTDGNLLYSFTGDVDSIKYVGLLYGDWWNNATAVYDDFTIAPEPVTICILSLGAAYCTMRRRKHS
ncbi:MAG: hypothetical protein JW936_09165 [Sedimentisphaerales bacterium]|nr:hypothetical protein [Sedimentisphaerales bacterium]